MEMNGTLFEELTANYKLEEAKSVFHADALVSDFIILRFGIAVTSWS